MDLAVGQTMIDCGTASSANHEQRAYEDLILKKTIQGTVAASTTASAPSATNNNNKTNANGNPIDAIEKPRLALPCLSAPCPTPVIARPSHRSLTASSSL
jgi:hypothetical protein